MIHQVFEWIGIVSTVLFILAVIAVGLMKLLADAMSDK